VRIPAGLASALLVALCLLAPVALAQAPSPAAAVDISGTEVGTVRVEQPSTFTFTVRNNGTAPPGTEEQAAADVTVVVEGVPAGWTVSVDPPSFRLAPGASQAVKVQVQVSTEAEATEAALTVRAVLVAPLGVLEDILGQEVPGASQTATDTAPLRITVDTSLTRAVLETLGPWVYALLLLLVAAVLVAIIVTVSSRRAQVRLTAETREKTVAPGGKVAFDIRVEGLARDADTVLLQVSAVPEGWAAFLPVPELQLEPGQSQDVGLVVIAPATAEQGSRQAVLVSATSAKAPKGVATVEFVAIVQGPQDLPTAPRRVK
jgi:hypothetical protein